MKSLSICLFVTSLFHRDITLYSLSSAMIGMHLINYSKDLLAYQTKIHEYKLTYSEFPYHFSKE